MAEQAPLQSEIPAVAAVDAPDWDAIATEVTCPLCGYNLRGLAQPLCPECGYTFDWPSVLDPKLRVHPYVFEHHPERNIRSFFRTLVRNFAPFTFWKELQPNQPSRMERLMVYWAICAVVALAPAAWTIGWPYFTGTGRTGSFLEYLTAFRRVNDGRALIAFWVVCAIFPALNFVALLVYRQSMRRARVKRSHVFRCCVYSGDAIVWNALWQVGVVAVYRGDDRMVFGLFANGFFCLIGLNACRLVSAYRWYLRFDHAVATVLAQQIILVLMILILLTYTEFMI